MVLYKYMELPDPDDFPHKALNEIFTDEAVEQLGYTIELHEYDQKVRYAKETVREALMATGDFQLRYLAEVVELEAESEGNDLSRAIADVRELLDNYADELEPAEYQDLTQQYNQLHNVWLAYAVVVDSLADHLVSGYIPDDKRDLQLEVMECKTLSPDSKVAALAVIDELLHGEGLDLRNADMVFAELENKRQEEEREERSLLLREYVKDELDRQIDFLEKHHIHPTDPAWRSLRSYLARSLAVADHKVRSSFDAALSYMVNEWLAQLQLSRQDYDELAERVRPKIDSDSSE